jgi:hypothetical protein
MGVARLWSLATACSTDRPSPSGCDSGIGADVNEISDTVHVGSNGRRCGGGNVLNWAGRDQRGGAVCRSIGAPGSTVSASRDLERRTFRCVQLLPQSLHGLQYLPPVALRVWFVGCLQWLKLPSNGSMPAAPAQQVTSHHVYVHFSAAASCAAI